MPVRIRPFAEKVTGDSAALEIDDEPNVPMSVPGERVPLLYRSTSAVAEEGLESRSVTESRMLPEELPKLDVNQVPSIAASVPAVVLDRLLEIVEALTLTPELISRDKVKHRKTHRLEKAVHALLRIFHCVYKLFSPIARRQILPQ